MPSSATNQANFEEVNIIWESKATSWVRLRRFWNGEERYRESIVFAREGVNSWRCEEVIRKPCKIVILIKQIEKFLIGNFPEQQRLRQQRLKAHSNPKIVVAEAERTDVVEINRLIAITHHHVAIRRIIALKYLPFWFLQLITPYIFHQSYINWYKSFIYQRASSKSPRCSCWSTLLTPWIAASKGSFRCLRGMDGGLARWRGWIIWGAEDPLRRLMVLWGRIIGYAS